MNDELKFLGKILRNGFILSGIYFVSVLASGGLSLANCKPILIFFLGYIFAEAAKRYGLHPNIKSKKRELMVFA